MMARLVCFLLVVAAVLVACSMKQVCYYIDPRELADGGELLPKEIPPP